MDSKYLKELTDYLDDRYVLQGDCDDIQKENNKKFANDDKRIDIFGNDLLSIKKLMWVIATTTIGQLIATIFEKVIGG